MYKAATKIDQDAYECPGSRQIGTTSDGLKIWLIGGYSDVMPSASMHQIVDKSITHLSKEENSQFVDSNRLDPELKKTIIIFRWRKFLVRREAKRKVAESAGKSDKKQKQDTQGI